MLDLVLLIALWLVFVITACFLPIPIGNENSTVRRLPWVTFGIMAINVLLFYVTLPATARQGREWMQAREELLDLIKTNQELLGDEEIRRTLKDHGLLTKQDVDEIEKQLATNADWEREFRAWLRGAEAAHLRTQFETRLADYKSASEASIWYKYGVSPNGNWKIHQLVTAAFLHGDVVHLFGNLLFFFAIAFSLEDLWGRNVFLGFYLLAGAAACVPDLINPGSLPMIGASGAISGTMGAFLVRLYKTKIKLAWLCIPFALPIMLTGRRPFGTANVPAYVFLPFYFIGQVLYWWFYHRFDLASNVGYSAHVAGFVFGAAFALVMKASKAEETYINPKIEAKVSFQGSPAVTQALGYLDGGDVIRAEQKLRSHIVKNPNDVNAIMAMIQVYQQAGDNGKLNSMYGRLIRHHLANGDKEAAIYAYDGLLSSFPDDQVEVSIPIRDWLVLCEYLKETGMQREAAVEYERLAGAHPADSLTVRACMQGGEAALAARDFERALRLFEHAQKLNPPSPLASRIASGIEKCTVAMHGRPEWSKPSGNTQPLPSDV